MTLPLHVSTLSCHSQGARSQYLAKLHKYVNTVLEIQYKISHIFYGVEISMFKAFKNNKTVLFMYVNTGPVQGLHQHTDCIYGHHTGVRVNYKNKMILDHFVIKRTI
jgi:hypothetical protein